MNHEHDQRLALKLIYRDLHGHYPNFDVHTMNIYDVKEKYEECWQQYKTKVVSEALHADR